MDEITAKLRRGPDGGTPDSVRHHFGLPEARMPSLVLLFLCTVAPLQGCPRGGQAPLEAFPLLVTANPAAEAKLREARAAAESGDSARAVQLYEAFLRGYPADPLVPAAQLELGRLRMEAGDLDAAAALFDAVAHHSERAVAERGVFFRAVLHHAQGNFQKAVSGLEPFVGRTIDPEETALLLQTLAKAHRELGDIPGLLRSLDLLARSGAPDEAKAWALKTAAEIAEADAPPEPLKEAYENLPREGEVWKTVARHRFRRAYADGDIDVVQEVAADLREENVRLDPELQALVSRAEEFDSEQGRPRIGAIIPLTGRGREVGQDALRGLMLAAESPPTEPFSPVSTQTELVLRDDESDPARAIRALEELVLIHGARAIVGPLDVRLARAIAPRAQQMGVPIITLSPDATLPSTGDFVFRLFPAPEEEAAALVASARERGAAAFGILYPDHGYGRAQRAAFTQAVQNAGGRIAIALSYAPGTTTFKEQAETLKEAPFEALFIADSARSVALIAPTLAAVGLWSDSVGGISARGERRTVQLLCPSVGFAPDLSKTTGRYLRGAIFAQSFYSAATESTSGLRFVQRFQERYGQPPGPYAAYAYDAFKLLAGAMEGGAQTSSEIARALALSDTPSTLVITDGFDADRSPRSVPRLLEFDGAEFRSFRPPQPELPLTRLDKTPSIGRGS